MEKEILKKNSLAFSIILNSLITIIFILVLFLAAKSTRNSTLHQQSAMRSQFLSRITLKTSVGMGKARHHLLNALSTNKLSELLNSEEQFLASYSNYKLLLSDQRIRESHYNSAQYLPFFDELQTDYNILLADETKSLSNKNLLHKMVQMTNQLSQDLLTEESVIWYRESQQLRQFIFDKDNDKLIFLGLTILFIITQFLVMYFIVTKNRLIKKINLQNEQIVQQTRLSTLGVLSAELAHEINSPLMVIDGRLKIIEANITNAPHLNEKIQTNLDIIKKNSNRIHSIIKSFKTMANDGTNDEFNWFPLQNLFDEVKEITNARCLKKQIKLSLKDATNLPNIWCNKVQLTQVLTNLVTNSIDAVRHLDHKWINIDVENNELQDMIKIIITDSGDGISPEIVNKMFQSFYTTKSSNEGTGLGLSISKKIMLEHDGDLIFNADSPNTQFILTLKKKKAQE